MSGQEIRLDAPRADRGGRDLADAGRDIAGVRSSVGGAIQAAAERRPWGADDIGAQFQPAYAAGERSIMDAWATIAAYVQALGAATVTAVTDLTGTDTQSAERVRAAYRP